MSKLKESFLKSMNLIMLDCDQATLLATQNSVDKIGCIKRLQLNLHLMGCKLCRTFVKQTELITKEIKKEADLDSENFKVHLTSAQKKQLKSTIEKNIT